VSTIWETLDLVARWIHVIAGIMWVGNSLLFNWLDRSLTRAGEPGQTSKPVGRIWLLHSGGFYYVEKTLLENEKMPGRVHWFMWQAYTTWISGALLLIIVYYAGGRAVLADPSVAAIPHWQAVLIGVGAIFAGFGIYQWMQKESVPPRAGTAIWMVALTAIAIALTQLLNGRAAFLHVGAMLATIMAGNVGHTIVPSQRALVASVEGGQSSQELSDRAKRVSIHNNYFTFPVIVLMLISHFPALYGHHLNWLLLLVLVAGGAAVRHALNIRWTSTSWKPLLAGSIAATVVPAWALLNIAPGSAAVSGSSPLQGGVPRFEDVRHVIDRRCGVCHSARPTDTSLGRTPAGVKFDTPQEIMMHAQRIHARAVVTKTMPPANKTGITDDERELIGRWFSAGSPVE
jgi:uncharacterized membrane protein